MKDNVISLADKLSPKHYKDLAIAPYDYITKNRFPWALGNVIKYISRYLITKEIVDLHKAAKYLKMFIEDEEGTEELTNEED